jgi:hypothetical protein
MHDATAPRWWVAWLGGGPSIKGTKPCRARSYSFVPCLCYTSLSLTSLALATSPDRTQSIAI